jgi:hypothetical protein
MLLQNMVLRQPYGATVVVKSEQVRTRSSLDAARIVVMVLRVRRVGSHGRWKRPCLQTAHMTI